ncbi:hypothetical protein AB0I54_02170 [Streptomyces sp. NPDC050625]|uniref:hypothetical protein n=1 Tax=Streptomyces sp. NPDC050625 TaxID=3154629 RepID=UPI00342A732E
MGYTERPRRIVRPTLGTGQSHASAAPAAPAPGIARRELYGPRSAPLLEAVRRLDAGLDEQASRSLADWVREQYTTSYGSVPLGFVARCYLGPPYVDHQLNLFHVIVRHFAPAEQMPEPFSAARMLARSGGYAYVEVYADGLVLPVLDDGTVVRP